MALLLALGLGAGVQGAGEPAVPPPQAAAAAPLSAPLVEAGQRFALAAEPLPAPRERDGDPLVRAFEREAGDDPWAVSERAFYTGLRELARTDPGALEARAEGLLFGSGPDPEKVALLRALWDTRSEIRAELFLRAVRELPDTSRPQAESVPSFAVTYLGRRAGGERLARKLLEQLAFEAPPPTEALRRRSAAGLFRHAEQGELGALRARLAGLRDERLLESALDALARNPGARGSAAAQRLLAEHGRDPAPPPEIQDEPL